MPNPNTGPDPKDDPPAIVQFPAPQPDPQLGGAAPPPSRAPAAPAAPDAAPAAAPAAAPGAYQPNLTPRAPGAADIDEAARRDSLGQGGYGFSGTQNASPIGRAPLTEADKDPFTTHFATPGVGSASAPDKMAADNIRPGANEARHDFEAQDPNIKDPSDFVGFDRYAGVNDDLMRQIADRNSDTSSAARQTALGFLSDAQNEATADVPVEQTASYKKYLDAMKKTNDAGQSFNAKTGNPYEDALRGIYAPAQTARDNRLQANAVNSGNVSAGNRNRFNATQKANADAAAAAARASDAAGAAAAKVTARREEIAAGAEDRKDKIDKRTGRLVDDETTTKNRRVSYGGNSNKHDVTDYDGIYNT